MIRLFQRVKESCLYKLKCALFHMSKAHKALNRRSRQRTNASSQRTPWSEARFSRSWSNFNWKHCVAFVNWHGILKLLFWGNEQIIAKIFWKLKNLNTMRTSKRKRERYSQWISVCDVHLVKCDSDRIFPNKRPCLWISY